MLVSPEGAEETPGPSPTRSAWRVLVVHNRYVSSRPSGENQTVAELVTGLSDAGVEVRTYIRDSDEIATMPWREKVLVPIRPLYSAPAQRELAALVDEFRPDIVQVHNPYPLISPMVIRLAARRGAAVVNYVHNYRHVCMAGTFYRDGHDCTDCSGHRLPRPGVVHACYQQSYARSAVMAMVLGAHGSTWDHVDRFVAISEHVRQVLIDNHFPAERIRVVPNAVDDPGDTKPLGRGFVFTGRLDATKGVELLLESWNRASLGASHELHVAGDGPLRSFLEAQRTPGLRYHGALTRAAVGQLIDACAVAVVPSTWQEPFGRTAIEALARGRPVVATAVGGLSEIVPDDVGWLCDPDPASLARGLAAAASATGVGARSRAARRHFLAGYTRRRQIDRLLSVYEQAAASRLTPPRR